MGEIDTTPKNLQKIVDDLLNLEDGLSKWELKFVESIDVQLHRGLLLVPKQVGKLIQIQEARL